MLHRMLPLLSAVLFGAFSLAASAANPQVEFDTTAGRIRVELYPDAAPKTVANFIDYVKARHYDGTQFHRVIPNFMIQGGGFTADFAQKPTRPPVVNEAEQAAKAGLRNVPGTLAMARTSDPHSASAQFFINLVPNTFLDYPSRDGWGYAVFGKVVKGMDVVDAIRGVPTTTKGPFRDVPADPVTIESVSVVAGR